MKNIPIKTTLFVSFLFCVSHTTLQAQDQNTSIRQDAKFTQLLNEKRKINPTIAANERYKIQVFSGDSEKAKKALYECKQQFSELDGTIVFNTPNYKVWIGNFRTRIETERNMLEIKKKYPNAFLIKPQK
ncbi:SPOR domain-containing protein [Flavobacterium crassostreae]|uniref:Sporulation protein n=1 Tax=Flavobacterium crassostreae TaxID=1763534 RepID=A0A1B9DXC2_9FLAO|nr:SPOR domain-containing protein [Flavobacterium crassostreae]OCB74329.1 sporulation protein [Flavobacterium crassostreae]